METPPPPRRPLGSMVAAGFRGLDVAVDLAIARSIGATLVEILPDWRRSPDPGPIRSAIEGSGLAAWSVHGGWGSQVDGDVRIDLASLDPAVAAGSVDALRAHLDWAVAVGASLVVVHPGGSSSRADLAARSAVLADSLRRLADHGESIGVRIAVENMPRGVAPGSSMSDLRRIVESIGRPGVGLALDTGHARLTTSPEAETRAAAGSLVTTHVHDNDGVIDAHLSPGRGSIDWAAWVGALDEVGYRGPIVLECIRRLRDDRSAVDDALIGRLRGIAGGPE